MIKKKAIKEKSKSFINEFKQFISRGNVIDLAVGVIIGGAFGKIVTSIVNDIIMPLIGALFGGQQFTSLSFKLNDVEIMYGLFIQNIIDFLIVALFVFIIIKLMNSLTHLKEEPKKDEEKKKETPPAKPDDIKLLEEIRDLLKNEDKKKKTTK
jgi:large conductance mechanosensitive channel protein